MQVALTASSRHEHRHSCRYRDVLLLPPELHNSRYCQECRAVGVGSPVQIFKHICTPIHIQAPTEIWRGRPDRASCSTPQSPPMLPLPLPLQCQSPLSLVPTCGAASASCHPSSHPCSNCRQAWESHAAVHSHTCPLAPGDVLHERKVTGLTIAANQECLQVDPLLR